MQLRKHFTKNHHGLDFDFEQSKFEEQKNNFEGKWDMYTCNYVPKGKEHRNEQPCGQKFANI